RWRGGRSSDARTPRQGHEWMVPTSIESAVEPALVGNRPEAPADPLGLRAESEAPRAGIRDDDDLPRTVRLNRSRPRLVIRTNCRVARVGPTTPTHVRGSRGSKSPRPSLRAAAARSGKCVYVRLCTIVADVPVARAARGPARDPVGL